MKRVMQLPYTVALVVDPNYSERLRALSARVHVWAVDTSPNLKIAQSIWNALPSHGEHSVESGVTIFTPYGAIGEDWCLGIIADLNLHHDSSSHDPEFTVLEVYGVAPSQAIREAFSEFGFVDFHGTSYGFAAKKIAT